MPACKFKPQPKEKNREYSNKSYAKHSFEKQRSDLIRRLKCGINVRLETIFKYQLVEFVYSKMKIEGKPNKEYLKRKSDGKPYKDIFTQAKINSYLDKLKLEQQIANAEFLQPLIEDEIDDRYENNEEIDAGAIVQDAEEALGDVEAPPGIIPNVEAVQAPPISLPKAKVSIKPLDPLAIMKTKATFAEAIKQLQKAVVPPGTNTRIAKIIKTPDGRELAYNRYGIMQDTATKYIKQLKRILRELECPLDDLVSCFKEPSRYITWIAENISEKSRRDYISIIRSLLKYFPKFEYQLSQETKDKYLDELKDGIKAAENRAYTKTKTRENISQLEFMALQKALEQEEKYGDAHLLSKLYLELPLRSDFYELKLVKGNTTKTQLKNDYNDSNNYYLVNDGIIILNQYKTKDSYKQQQIKVSIILKTFIKDFLKQPANKDNKYLISNEFNDKYKSPDESYKSFKAAWARYGLKGDIKDVRRAAITYWSVVRGKDKEFLEALADKMLHSWDVQQNVYKRQPKLTVSKKLEKYLPKEELAPYINFAKKIKTTFKYKS